MATRSTITVEGLKAFARDPPTDHKTRKQLYEAAKELMFAVESPPDTDHRLLFGTAQTYLTTTGSNLNLYSILSKNSPQTITQLSQACSADPVFLHRTCRFLAAIGVIAETGPATYSANHITTHLATPGFRSAIAHHANLVDPSMIALPAWLEKNGYINPTDSKHLPFQPGLQTDEDIMGYLMARPDKAAPTFEYMAYAKADAPTWMDGSVPVTDFQLSDSDVQNGRTLLVDVGGGSGHQALALRAAFSHLKGKMVVQDLPVMVNMIDTPAAQAQNVEPTAHDFFTPQPVEGAKAYYLRMVLHDWNDDKCKVILGHLREAMASDSVVVIDECVVPDRGASYRLVTFDLAMLTCTAGMERSEGQWRALLAECGLALRDVYIYDEDVRAGLLVAVPV